LLASCLSWLLLLLAVVVVQLRVGPLPVQQLVLQPPHSVLQLLWAYGLALEQHRPQQL
jgi:hypothetical protein